MKCYSCVVPTVVSMGTIEVDKLMSEVSFFGHAVSQVLQKLMIDVGRVKVYLCKPVHSTDG